MARNVRSLASFKYVMKGSDVESVEYRFGDRIIQFWCDGRVIINSSNGLGSIKISRDHLIQLMVNYIAIFESDILNKENVEITNEI